MSPLTLSLPIVPLIDFTLSNVRRFYSSMVNTTGLKGLNLSESEILYGVQNGFSSCLTPNHLIFIELKTELKNFI